MKIKNLLKNQKSILNLGEFSTPPHLFQPPPPPPPPLANYILVIFPGPPTIPTSPSIRHQRVRKYPLLNGDG